MNQNKEAVFYLFSVVLKSLPLPHGLSSLILILLNPLLNV